MLAYLIALLALVFSLHPAHLPNVASGDIISKIEDKIAEVAAPESKALEHIGQGIPEEDAQEENAETSSQEESEAETAETPELPDTTKILTYNTESEHEVGEVPQVAVDNAPPLEPSGPCSELIGGCEFPADEPTITPTPPTVTPTPPVDIDPEPIEWTVPPQPQDDCFEPPADTKPPVHPLVACP